MVNTAPANTPSPYNHHIYSTEPPAEDKLTLCGFEGPEKLLEIWFKPNPSFRPHNHRNHHHYNLDGETRSESPSSIRSSSLTEDDLTSSSSASETESLIDVPIHSYNHGNAYQHVSTDSRAPEATNMTSTTETWSYKRTGLRTVPRPIWEEMLDIVKCKVLSLINNEHADAYLLSESSMFIYPNRLMLKTCGTTTLLNAIPKIFEIARDYCGLVEIEALFYSRKAFLFPERQVYPHGKWGDEVLYLDTLFPEDGYETSGYVVGKVNGDHWCMYTATPLVKVLNEDGDEVSVDAGSSAASTVSTGEDEDAEEDEEEEVTLEIMMQELDPDVTKLFFRTEEEQKEAQEQEAWEAKHGKLDLSHIVNLAKQPQGINGVHKNVRKGERRLLKETGIQEIYPCSMVDDFLFDPCGYSLNGLLGPYYWTIHVTPEDICSYASFETTIPVRKFYRPNPADIVDGNAARDFKKKGVDAGSAAGVKPAFRQGSASEYECYEDVIDHVLECFKPGKFSVTLFSRKSHGRKHGRDGRGLMDGAKIDGFKRTDKIVHDVGKWDLVFSHYVKNNASKVVVKDDAAKATAAATARATAAAIAGMVR
ncbi:UNVERIFIED_CONTAM: spermidine resistance protein [Siphonaria sp. JEL0065]|nr:spermidine resistance protein [Siphonaria sp. JEL0065]